VAARTVKVSHPEKVLFPASDAGPEITKGELVEYYLTVAGAMLPLVAGRPLSLERYPDGIDKKGFFQQQASKYFPDWIERVTVWKAPATKGAPDSVAHPVFRHPEDLAYVANQNTITPHVWLSRAEALQHPDLLVFDLDPAGDDDRPTVKLAATELRKLLGELELPCFVKATGSRGLHIVVPLDSSADTAECDAFAFDVARVLESRQPDRFSTEWLVEDRGGKLLLDTARNRYAQMIAAPYAVRAKPGAPVSVPLSWDEVDDFEPRKWTLRNVPERLASVEDPWAGMAGQAVSVAAARDRLTDLAPDLEPTSPDRRPSRFGRKDRRLRGKQD
jgi:bifunctional non-homologous end joining protein LigD